MNHSNIKKQLNTQVIAISVKEVRLEAWVRSLIAAHRNESPAQMESTVVAAMAYIKEIDDAREENGNKRISTR